MSVPRGCCERVTGIISGSFYSFFSYFQTGDVTDTEKKTKTVATIILEGSSKGDKSHHRKISASTSVKSLTTSLLEDIKKLTASSDLFSDIFNNSNLTDEAKLKNIKNIIAEELKSWGVKVAISDDGIVKYVKKQRECYKSVYHITRLAVGLKEEYKKENLFDPLKELCDKITSEDTEIESKCRKLNEEIVEWLKANETARSEIPKIIKDLDDPNDPDFLKMQPAIKFLRSFYEHFKSDNERPKQSISSKLKNIKTKFNFSKIKERLFKGKT